MSHICFRMIQRLFFTVLFLSVSMIGKGQYTISGKVNISEGWQPKVYMAAINKLSDYYRTSPDMILNTAEVDVAGRFELRGDNLPTDSRYYRLYIMKDQNTDYDACLYVGGDDHNFVHVVLKNGESVEIISDPNSVAPFGDYSVIGGGGNHAMRELSSIVFPSFYFYRIKFPTELKFSEDKFHLDLRNYADSSKHTMAALAAVNNMDFDEYYDRDEGFFQEFGGRLKSDMPHSVYTKNYMAKLRYYSNEDSHSGVSRLKILIGFLSAALLLLLIWIFWLYRKLNAATSVADRLGLSSEEHVKNLRQSLTQKETEILTHIQVGKSNKDIATELFIELSTVKTHINKLYAKIGAANRSEAKEIADALFIRD